MRIGILGGGFDPPHIGHLIACETVREKLKLDKVIFIPTFNPPHKEIFTPFHHRFKMTELAVSDNPHFSISDIEKSLGVPSFTIQTLKALKKSYPEGKIYLLIGTDEFRDFKDWESPEEIPKIVEIVVLYRPGYPLKEFPKSITPLQIPQIDVSSTQIRESIKERRSVKYLIPDKVWEYIKHHSLYEDMPNI